MAVAWSTDIPQTGSLVADFDFFMVMFLPWLLLWFLILVVVRWLKILSHVFQSSERPFYGRIFFNGRAKSEQAVHRTRDHKFFIRGNDMDNDPPGRRGYHPLIHYIVIHNILQTWPAASHRRA